MRSNRVGPTFFAQVAQLGERQTEDLNVPGSSPGLGMFLPVNNAPIAERFLAQMITINLENPRKGACESGEKKMQVSKTIFSRLLANMKDEIEVKPFSANRREHLLILRSAKDE